MTKPIQPAPERPTSGKPIEIDGLTFRCYRTGIMRYVWRDDTERIEIGNNHPGTTQWASIDGKRLPTRFRGQKSAMNTAVRLLRERKTRE